MNIRPEQMQALRRDTEEAYAVKAAARLRGFFPKHTAFMGDEAVAKVVELGIARARAHHLTTERGIQVYLSLMLYLGSEFDRDPQYSWAHALLDGEPSREEKIRIDDIMKTTGDFLAAVAGPNREHAEQALNTLIDGGTELITRVEPPVNSASLRRLLTTLYPQKAAYLGDEGLASVMQSGLAAARRYGLEGPEPVVLFSFLLLLLGSYADQDPQFAWIPAALALSAGDASPRQRFEKLLERSFERLHAWVAGR
jgi:hypothetical protein